MRRLWILALAGLVELTYSRGLWQVSAAVPSRFQFREPGLKSYRVEENKLSLLSVSPKVWLRAFPENGSTNSIEIGNRVVLQLSSPSDLARLLKDRPLTLSRTITRNLFILQSPDAWTAAREAERLAALPEVLASYPVTRRPRRLHSQYAPLPNDPYFNEQWNLENRGPDGSPAGVDLNVRAAWPISRGEGVLVAVCDDGIELDHPDLAASAAGGPHFNFVDGTTDGLPLSSSSDHGTSVAGLAIARGGNKTGMSGVAPLAQLASLVIFSAFDNIASEEQLMDMFQYRSNAVSIQNHSWGIDGFEQLAPSLLEQVAISNATVFGRGGRGVIMVRSGGNNRRIGGNSNDDGYASDPRAIGVAAVRFDGRVASYSSPGASILVAAPSGDSDDGYRNIFTTDRKGSLGYNQATVDDRADYAFDSTGFSGTSAASPQISGLAALLLSANPLLTYRDVQQILIQSARHFDLTDPDLTTNGAGFRISHNVGFGVPDAGQAVILAKGWISRPPLTNLVLTSSETRAVPDDGLRLFVSARGVPTNLFSIRTQAGLGPHPDRATPVLSLVDLGQATNAVTTDLRGKAALIRRGENFFRDKIQFAANAGAAFAVVYNNVDGDDVITMGGTDFVPIPSVFIGQNDGEALQSLLQTNADLVAQIRLDQINYEFAVNDTLICEHIGVQVTSDHSSRGDLRITLVSPAGTRSVLQQVNSDATPGPSGWTYYTTHHFYESSAGTWKVYFSDESKDNTGSIQTVSLIIHGVPIVDTDRDGLDDGWEIANVGTLATGPKDDPDGDGYQNARAQWLEANPSVIDAPFKLDLSIFNMNYVRLSWRSNPKHNYEILGGSGAIAPSFVLTNLPGRFPETEWFMPFTSAHLRFLRVRAVLPEQ